MRKKYLNINDFGGTRYFNVNPVNVRLGQYTGVLASSNLMELSMQTRYIELIDKLKNYLSPNSDVDKTALQRFRNYMSALNGFLTFCGKTQESYIGTELGANFDSKLAAYLAIIDVAVRTRSDRAAQLRAIRNLHFTKPRQQDVRPRGSCFADELRKHVAIAAVPPKTLAREVGIDSTTFRNWLGGAQPRKANVPGLRRLEVRLGVERDSLVNLIENRIGAAPLVDTPAFRTKLSERTETGVSIPAANLPSEFLNEWKQFYEYKTSGVLKLQRSANGKWREIPRTISLTVCTLAQRGNMTCPSAEIHSGVLRNYFGTLIRIFSEESPHILLEPSTVSLAWCAHPQLLERYLRWLSEQSNGLRHGGHKKFAATISSMLRGQTGYLWQQSEIFRTRLPSELQPKTKKEWQVMCEQSYKFLREIVSSSNGKSRIPEEPIAHLLELEDPFKPVFDAIKSIQADAACSLPGGIRQARHKRNALLLALLLSNPLRLRTLACLTWTGNSQGTIQGSVESGWRIVLQPPHLKNGNSKNARSYNVKIADWVKPLLDEYITEYRDILLRGRKSPYLFVADGEIGIWHELGRTVFRLTKRYIAGSPGIGPHAFRHLVATTWLRKNPGDFLTVAELLNDKLSTVMENYAHLRRDDSFSRYEAQLGKQFPDLH